MQSVVPTNDLRLSGAIGGAIVAEKSKTERCSFSEILR